MSVEEAQELFGGKLIDLTQLDNREKKLFDLTKIVLKLHQQLKVK